MIFAGNFKDTYFILDVESGTVLDVDKVTYDVAKRWERGEPIQKDALSEEQQEAYEELMALKEQGMFDSPNLLDEQPLEFSKPVVKALCLNIAHDCNLRCTYCFAKDGTYQGERGLMTREVARAALDFLVEQSQNRKNLEVDFFGGEPLINFDVVRYAVEYGTELAQKRGKNIRFTLTTNGYALDEEKIDYINTHMKNLVISIDGRKETHDKERKTPGGNGSYDRVVQNAKRAIQKRGDQEYYIRGTFTPENLDFTQDVKAIYDMGFSSLSIEPVVTKGRLELKQEHMERVDQEYDALAQYIEDLQVQGKPVCFFHFMVDLTSGPCLNKRLRGCGAGAEYIAVTPKGDVYPCHQFASQQAFYMGNVLKGDIDFTVAAPIADAHVQNKPECKKCWAKYFCSGGCAANAYGQMGDVNKPYEIGCQMTKMRMERAIALFIRKRQREQEKA